MTSETQPTPCDIVAFTAHPDDLELTCGGTMALCAKQGWKTGAVEFTRGELGTRGTAEIRQREAARAAEVLGLSCRLNLEIPDGHVRNTDEARRKVVRLLRILRPRVVIAPPLVDHHPDHTAVAEILSRTVYLGGVVRYAPGEPPWRPHVLLHYLGSLPVLPELVVDVTEVFDIRTHAIHCYESQFSREGPGGPPTRIAHPSFLAALDGACRRHGALIGVPFGEGFTTAGPVPVSDLVGLYARAPWSHAALDLSAGGTRVPAPTDPQASGAPETPGEQP